MQHNYTFEDALAASQRVNWRIEDIIGGDKRLDFTKPFMPETLARVRGMSFLTPDEMRTLNQIRGHAYLCIFGLVEEFILPFVLDHARPHLHWRRPSGPGVPSVRRRGSKAYSPVQGLPGRVRDRVRNHCDVIGSCREIAHAVLSHHPLAVALLILHIDWMTQRHYVEGVKDDHDLDAQFKSLLRHHWMEAAQHAKLDTLMVEAIVEDCKTDDLEGAVQEYLEMGMMFDEALKQQTTFDLEAFHRATGRVFVKAEQDEFMTVQHQANRWTYLGTGMTHPNVLATVESFSPPSRGRIEQIAPAFC